MVAQAFLCHRFARVTLSYFLEARSLIVDITYLNVFLYQYLYFVISFVFGETPKRVILQTVKAKMKCNIISCISLGSILLVKIKRSSEKRIHFGLLFLLKNTT